MRQPVTDEEWQEAVDAAQAFLVLEASRAYGLVKGGPEVDVARCEELLARGSAQGFKPAPDAADRMVISLVSRQADPPEGAGACGDGSTVSAPAGDG